MSVHYKFKSAISYDTIAFDGLHISVRDLKKAILHQKQIGKSTDFDLQITNAQSNEVYTDEGALIPKNSSLIVVRVPLTAQQKKAWEKSDAAQLHLIGLNKGSSDSPDHLLNKFAKSADLTAIDASEEDKIQAAIAQSTLDYDPSNYVRIKGSNQVGEIPPNYRCYKCMQPGHWIKDCKLNAQQDASIEIRKSTGIPRSFMVPVEGPEVPGAMMTPSGQFAIPTIDHEARKEAPKKHQGGENVTVEKPSIPDDLLCGVCKDLLTDAVMIPCCGNSFCDECIRNVLLESEDHQCPDCKEKDVSPDTLIPNRFLRNSVNNFKNQTGYSRVVPLKPPPAPPQKKVETALADSTGVEPLAIETVVLDPPEIVEGSTGQAQQPASLPILPSVEQLPEPIEVKDDGDDDCTISGSAIPRLGSSSQSSPLTGNAIPSLSGQPIRNLAYVYHNNPHTRINLSTNPNFIPKGEDPQHHIRDHHHYIRRGRGDRSGTPTVDEHGNRGYHSIQSLGAPRPLMPPHHHPPPHPPPHLHFSQSGGYVFQPFRDYQVMDDSRYRGHHYQGRSRSRPSYRQPLPAQHSPPNGNIPPGSNDKAVDKIFEDFMKAKDSRKRDKQRSYSRSYSRTPSPRGPRNRSRSPKRSRSRHRSPLGRSPRGRSVERKSGRSRIRSRSRTRGTARSHSQSKSRSPQHSYKRRSRSRSKSPSFSISSRSRSRSVTSQSGRRSPLTSRRRRGSPLPPGISPPNHSPNRYYSSKYHSSSNESSRYKSSNRSASHYPPRSQDFHPAQEYARYNERYDTRNVSRERSHSKRYEDPLSNLGNDWERIRDNEWAQINKGKQAEFYSTSSHSSSQERHRRKISQIIEEESENIPEVREIKEKEKEKKIEPDKPEKKEVVEILEDKTPPDTKTDQLSDKEKTPEKKIKEKKKKKREESDKKKKKRKLKEKIDKKEDEEETPAQADKVEVKEKIRGNIIALIKPDDLYKDLDASVDMKALENMGKHTSLTAIKTTAEADSSTAKDVMLAPVPELSKWEKDDDYNTSLSDVKSADSVNKKDPSNEEIKQVTSEVLKRAENAIFKKSVNPLKPSESKVREKKKESEKKDRVINKEPIVVEQYPKEPVKPVKSIALPVKTEYDEGRHKKAERIVIPDKEKPRISAKERLGAKVDEIVIKRSFGLNKSREVKGEVKVDKGPKVKEIKRVDTAIIHRDHRDRRESKSRKVSVRKKEEEQTSEKVVDKKHHPPSLLEPLFVPDLEISEEEKEVKEEKKIIIPPQIKKRSSSEENMIIKKLKSSHQEESSCDSSDDSIESIKKSKKKKRKSKKKKKKKSRSKQDSSSDGSDSSTTSTGSDSEDNRKKRKHKTHKTHKKSKKRKKSRK